MKNLTLPEQVQELLKNEGLQKVYQHARVSLDNRHYCQECFTCACVRYLNTKAVRTSFKDIDQVIFFNDRIGHHFFDADTMRFFKSRIESVLIKNRLFVTSDKNEDNPRLYTIRYVKKAGQVETLGDFQAYTTKKEAIQTAKALTKGLK